tara:strand:- start:129 stop:551 length:423 start_codon:yes stop_codon:yes gene_type:complete
MQSLNFDNPSSNILEQLASYNKSDINNFISNLQVQLLEQKELNNVLSNDNTQEDIDSLNQFIETNKEDIKSQQEELSYLVEQLQIIIPENKSKISEKEELQHISNSAETQEVAINIRKIRSMKATIQNFLVKNGIIQESV